LSERQAGSVVLPARETPEGIVIGVRLTPKGGADEILGVEMRGSERPVVKARVRAAPEGGKANAALEALIADWMDAPKTKCEVIAGGKSRLKQVLVRGDPILLTNRLLARLQALKSGA
jgi:uncharacterized protein YggU (UPF0235/DUF167 family)